MSKVSLQVNGEHRSVDVVPGTTLLHLLRDRLKLTGTKCGCNYGVCGACTVLIDGKPARACLALAHRCEGASIATIESVANGESLHPLQQALLDHGAVQCGFCTPGVVMSAKALLDTTSFPTPDQIRTALSGNLCRCSGYAAIIDAVGSVGHADDFAAGAAP